MLGIHISRKIKKEKKKKKTNLDDVLKAKDEKLLNSAASYLRHIKLCQDGFGKDLESSEVVHATSGGHACFN